jgi:hypothetical protein
MNIWKKYILLGRKILWCYCIYAVLNVFIQM